MTINSSMTSHLVLECDAPYSCYGFELLSPGPNTTFNITCSGEYSCESAVLELADTDHIHMECKDGYRACHAMTLSVHNSMTVDIECTSSRACSYTDFAIYEVNESSIYCAETTGIAGDHSCLYHSFVFNQSSFINIETAAAWFGDMIVSDAVSVHFDCISTYNSAFQGGELWFKNAGNISILSSGNQCMYRSDVTVITTNDTTNAQQVDVRCIGDSADNCKVMSIDAGQSNARCVFSVSAPVSQSLFLSML